MKYRLIIKKNSYYDSVTLMSFSKKSLNIEGVENSLIAMGTAMNKTLAKNLINSNEIDEITENDLFLLILFTENADELRVITKVENLFKVKEKNTKDIEYSDLSEVIYDNEDTNLAVISIPGEYAFRESMKALKNGLHVMLFSDNMSIEEEIKLKQYAVSKGLLLMGPDCGTSIINNIGLCFANKIKKGNIGIVGASGTGIQEAVVQLSKRNLGISQAIGIGGRDLKKEVGGIMMLSVLEALAQDENTDTIVVISKPPAKEVEQKILDKLSTINKKKIICFIDGENSGKLDDNTYFANSLTEIAKICADENTEEKLSQKVIEYVNEYIEDIKNKNVVGLYCGGTLCAETLHLLRNTVKNLKSNVAKKESEKLLDLDNLSQNLLIDLGDDYFTQGKAHPMIDPSIRLNYIEKALQDKNTGIIILDFEIGYGSNDNPVEETYSLIKKLQKQLKEDNRKVLFISYLCGTRDDYQGYDNNIKMLEEISVVANSNEQISDIVKYILK